MKVSRTSSSSSKRISIWINICKTTCWTLGDYFCVKWQGVGMLYWCHQWNNSYWHLWWNKLDHLYLTPEQDRSTEQVQSNLWRKDTLGTGLLSFVRRLSLSQRFNCIILKINNVLIIVYNCEHILSPKYVYVCVSVQLRTGSFLFTRAVVAP